MSDDLPFERLDAYRVGTELLELVAALEPGRGTADLYDQLKRASSSIVLNCAEACGKDGADRKRFFLIARGSALESAACLKALATFSAISNPDHDAGRDFCRRLYAMFTRLADKGHRTTP
jgi:four helix bundle protein